MSHLDQVSSAHGDSSHEDSLAANTYRNLRWKKHWRTTQSYYGGCSGSPHSAHLQRFIPSEICFGGKEGGERTAIKRYCLIQRLQEFFLLCFKRHAPAADEDCSHASPPRQHSTDFFCRHPQRWNMQVDGSDGQTHHSDPCILFILLLAAC